MPGQELRYAIGVNNKDVGCGSSTFAVRFSAPSGFVVSMPSSSITLKSDSSGYLWAYVTSPATAPDGNYPLSATVQRAGVSSSGASSWYKVYSSDAVPPKLYWMNPADGSAVSGRTTFVGFSSSDDHAVKKLVVYLDDALVAKTVCDGITYDCQVSYKWSTRRVRGHHTATYQSTDWMGNVATQTATFTVN
jgi:Bacterial Ig domain